MNYIDVVCALIINKNKILCVQRPNKGEVGLKWEFPGGKPEEGETLEEAIVREIYEELECKIVVDKFLGKIDHAYSTFGINLHAFKCSMIDGKFKLKEHIDFKWLNSDDLFEVDFAEADIKLIKKLLPYNKI